jgi:hypothetical protein
MPGFCYVQATITFKCLLRHSVFPFGQKGSTLNVTLSRMSIKGEAVKRSMKSAAKDDRN